MEVLTPAHVRMHVWERGAGRTLACGTGACATVVAGVLEGKTERKCQVGVWASCRLPLQGERCLLSGGRGGQAAGSLRSVVASCHHIPPAHCSLAYRANAASPPPQVDLPGGPLHIEWRESDNHIYMTGPAELVFSGTVGV